ncbi:O-antigen polymerase [Nitrobacter hamburgensis X14]|uniref:O-antigen polymerase n=1 Tax=Nitrobacter hamburgensis (strain DSM 10229 / NCIMB 13809 / X14) TaxID=323097 RepID=Q1QJM5_NITHX|nr:O-antigen polymerase [Nitrobacter hamburgensis X14]
MNRTSPARIGARGHHIRSEQRWDGLVINLRLSPATALRNLDILAVLIAASLPWSTSLPAIFAVIWLFALVPTIEPTLLQLFKRPICILPVAFFVLALAGTLWSSAPWTARLHAVGPLAKLLVIPLLIYHFRRSSRGQWVFTAFLVSCALLMIMSWIVAFDPRLALKSGAYYGVPIKNYIDQSQEFALCAVALAYPVVHLLLQKRIKEAALLLIVAVSFVANMMFVVVSRTALVTMPVMLGIFMFLHLTPRRMIAVSCTTLLAGVVMWFASPSLQSRVASFSSQYDQYETSDQATSIGLRLEFWRKSLRFFVDAPLAGHGTGSVQGLFTAAAVGQTGAAAEVVNNPHNQTLNAAVQWGSLGILVLYAMWLFHLSLFRGTSLADWVGLLVVAQNMMTSLFNSHLFDFHEGWMYVLGVGVAGGMVLQTRAVEISSRS